MNRPPFYPRFGPSFRHTLPGRKGVPMTVGAGFQGDNFVLLCADSQISRGVHKFQECKLYVLPGKDRSGTCACVYAGDVDFMKKVLPSIRRIVRSSDPEKVVSRLENEWDAIFRKMQTREKRKVEFPWIDMLFAISTASGPRLCSASYDIFRVEEQYETIGIGREMMRSVVEPAYPKHHSLSRREALLLAASGIKQAKDYVQGCGKKIHCLVLDTDLMATPFVDDLTEHEKRFDFLRAQTGSLLLGMSDIEQEESTFDERLENFVQQVKGFRQRKVYEEQEKRKETERS